MKKIIFLIAIKLAACYDIHAQNQYIINENYNFLNHAADINHTPSSHSTYVWQNNDCFTIDPPGFDGRDLPHWTVSHGYPNGIRHISDALCLGLEDVLEDNCGHGIAAVCNFEAGRQYSVISSFCFQDENGNPLNNLANGVVRFKLTQHHPAGRKWQFCCDKIPSLSGNVNQLAGSINQSNFNFQFNRIDFTAINEYNFLMVYPEQTTPGTRTSINLNAVKIFKHCLDYGIIAGDYIQPKWHTHYKYIQSGSVGSPSVSKINPNGKTVYQASKSILLTNNFEAKTNSGNYFVAEIVSFMCDIPTSAFNKNNESNSTEYNLIEGNKIRNVQLLLTKIHPNPTTGQLNITMPAPGDYDVKITNMLGVVVYQGKLKDEQQKQVQLDANLPSGNYTVQITGKEVNHIEKITLTR